MNAARIGSVTTHAAVFLVAGIFVVSGALKLLDPARFAIDIGRYRLVSPLMAAMLAVYLPWLEIVLGLGLAVPSLRPGARPATLVLLGMFSLVLLSVVLRGIDLRCGCFGGGGMSAGWALLRNLGLMGLLLWAGRARVPCDKERAD